MKHDAYASAIVALVTLAVAVCYTAVRCPSVNHGRRCNRRVLDVPGEPNIEVRVVSEGPTGRGRMLVCPRCRSHLEVIEHG